MIERMAGFYAPLDRPVPPLAAKAKPDARQPDQRDQKAERKDTNTSPK